MIKYKVTLTTEERKKLEEILAKGRHTTQVFRNACILLNSDEGAHGGKSRKEEIAKILHVNVKTIERIRQRFVEEGFEACIERKSYPEQTNIKRDGDFEAHLLALSCSKAPEGHARWTLRLLADKMVELNYVESVSHETVRQVLKKTNSSHGGCRAG